MNPIFIQKIPLLTIDNKSPFFPNMEFKILNLNPPIVHIKNLLSPSECQHIINLSSPHLTSSTMIVDNKEVVNNSRSSRSAFILPNGVLPNDPILCKLLTHLSQLCGVPIPHFEGFKTVNYQKGQQYVAHHDFFGQKFKSFTTDAGDRQMTFFIYLNSLKEEDGGSTSFPNLNIKVTPSVGDALFWLNIDFDGNCFDDTFHSGDPVLGNTEKWGANVWIRQQPYHKFSTLILPDSL